MTDSELADVIVDRLNAMISDADVRKDIQILLENRISVSEATVEHPTLVVGKHGVGWTLSALGLLNGIAGSPERIAAVYDEAGNLLRFTKTSGS